MIYVFTGDGKGKTTASLGQALRMVGQGKRVAIFQFIKSKHWKTGEEKSVKKFGNAFHFEKGGKGFVGILGDKLPRSVHEQAAKKLLKKVGKTILSKKFDLIILDEINVAHSLKLISLKDVLHLVRIAPDKLDLILTGRGAPQKLIYLADLVTEFKEVKHPFQKGIQGSKSREY